MTRHYDFKTIREFVEEASKPVPSHRRDRARITGFDRQIFTGTATFADACELALSGWPEGREKAKRFTSMFVERVSGVVKQPEIFWDVTGDSFDIGRVLSGEPESWMTLVDSAIERETISPRFCKIVMNMWASASMSAETLIRRGAAIAAVVVILENHGVRCTVELTCQVGDNVNEKGEPHETWIHIKDADEPLQLDGLIFATAHPSTFRRLQFGLQCSEPSDAIYNRYAFNVGGARNGEARDEDKGDIYLGAMYGSTGWSEAECIKWITESLKAQGLILDSERVNV